MHINDLPTEILVEIFLYLDAYEWIMVLSEVCSLWNSIISSYVPFWKDLAVFLKCEDFLKTDIEPITEFNSGIYINKKGLCKVKKLSNIKVIGTSHKHYSLEKILYDIYTECKSVTILVCHKCHGDITDSFLDLLNDLYPDLKSLKFTLCSSSLQKIPYHKISNFKYLESLITDDHCFTDSDLISLAKTETSITRLAVPCSHDISDYGLTDFLNTHKLHLEELHISGYRITSKCFSMISQCHRLAILTVFDARQLNDAELIELSKLPRLRILSLHRATFSKRSLYDFLNLSLKNNLNIYLDLKFYSKYNGFLKNDLLQKFPTLDLLF